MKPRLYLRLKPSQATSLLIDLVRSGVSLAMLPISVMCRAAGNGECGLRGVAMDENRKE
jgi:hypothetical protein